MIYRFSNGQSLAELQAFVRNVYGLTDDRLFSLPDLVSNQERFTMRALKGIRKRDAVKLKHNLLIALSWLMAIANRFHIDIETRVWQRFPGACSYCGRRPCACKAVKPTKRAARIERDLPKPESLADFQKMFAKIYPPSSRTLPDAGVHLAEEAGEVSEAVHVFMGEHKKKQFEDIANELADYVSCVFGAANSAGVDLEREYAEMYSRNCHVCHKAPCACKFSSVAKFKS